MRRLGQHLVTRAIVVGILAGFLAMGFHWALMGAAWARDAVVRLAHHYGDWGIVLPVVVGALGAGVAVFLVQTVAPDAGGSGIPHVEEVLLGLRRMRPGRVIPVKFVGGVLGIGGGLAIGREAPTVQMGAAVAELVNRWSGASGRDRAALLCAGAGAGLAAAFNAPLAGLIFILEEVRRDFTPAVFTATFIAAVAGDLVSRTLTGQLPAFHIPVPHMPPLAALPLFLAVGLLAGPIGVLFNHLLRWSLDLFDRLPRRPRGLKGLLAGAVAGLVAWYLPDVVGDGEPLLRRLLMTQTPLAALAGLFVLRFALTMISAGSGAPGGALAPLLVQGAILGLAAGEVTRRFFPGLGVAPESFVVVGMAAQFTASVRAPLTSIVLISEMTGGYELMLPVIVACLAAAGVAERAGDVPLFEALLARDLLRSPGDPALGESQLLVLEIQPDAPYAGREVHDLGLPPGCVLVAVQRQERYLAPARETRTEAGDRITVALAPGDAHAREALHAAAGPAAG